MMNRKLKIDILSSGGSPSFVCEQSIYGIDGRAGVGGAELGILTLCRLWHDIGHEVTFYNNAPNYGSEFSHANYKDFNKHSDRDVLIIFRSTVPEDTLHHAKGVKIFYSNDQHTTGSFREFRRLVDHVVVISEFHNKYFQDNYDINDSHIIDIPIRTWEYPDTPKVKNSCIFTSVPDRGLLQLVPIWKHIVEQVPDATLTITGDWSLWNNTDCSQDVMQYRVAFANKKNVNYLSAVKRSELVDIQNKAQFHLYPCTYNELFCISVAESQVAGVIPITSRIGAVDTTNRLGYKIDGNPMSHDFVVRFVDTVVGLMKSDNLVDIKPLAAKEFDTESILEKWDRLFYG